MAERTDFDSRPEQISKDLQGSDNPIPLSPQWLLPKPGENKSGVIAGENNLSPRPGYASHLGVIKSSATGQDLHDVHKKKDVFRPSVMDMESGRRDRWREEERDTNSFVRKDRWRDGDKELGDGRKVDRWTDSPGKHFGEARNAPGERWTDSGNRESNHDQRRESKWNTRWGPHVKDNDNAGGKLADSGKESEMLLDKGSSHPAYHGKDERDGDNPRWRSNSSYSRGRGDPPHQGSTPNKQNPMFSHGRGRGENSAPTFSLGRGKINSGGSLASNASVHQHPVGYYSEKDEPDQGEPSPVRYSRTKLLDVYRITDMRSRAKFLEGYVQVPSLTQEEPVEPLALCAPTPEELVILKGIDKGEISSSGAAQIAKDGAVGRNTNEYMQSRPSKSGGRDDLAQALDDSTSVSMDNAKGAVSNYSEALSHEKQMFSWPHKNVEKMQDYQAFSDHKLEALKEDSTSYRKNDFVPATKESSTLGSLSNPQSVAWSSSSFAERSHSTSQSWRETSSTIQKDLNNVWEKNLIDSSNPKREGVNWHRADDSVMRRQPSEVFEKELEPHSSSQLSPEDLVLYYKDPQGQIQGPFTGSDIIGWFEAGYFGIELQVRLANAPMDSPFAFLGDVMPHLRAKARPPPGFNAPKTIENQDATGRPNYNSLGKLHAISSEVDVMKNDPIYKQGSAADAENKFLESLMSGSISSAPFEKFALSEGMQGRIGNSSDALPPLAPEADPYLLAKKMTLERQRSLPNPYSYWPGRDAASLAAKSDIVNDPSLAYSKLMSSVAENSHAQHHSQNVDLMSLLQGSANSVSNGIGGLSNFAVQGGLDRVQDKLDMHNVHSFPPQAALGVQHQMLQSQSPLTNLLAQSFDNPSHLLALEKIISSSLPQDPRLSNLLQQQYLLQLQSQSPTAASQQLSLVELLLKQQQKQQEEQQQLLHQQQLLSQVCSEHNPLQHFGDPLFGQLQTAGLSAQNTSVDQSRSQPSPELFQIGSQMQIHTSQDPIANLFPTGVNQEIGPNIGHPTSSKHLPHQILGDTVHQRFQDSTLLEHINNKQHTSLMPSTFMDSVTQPETGKKYLLDQKTDNAEPAKESRSDMAPSFPSKERLEKAMMNQLTDGHEIMSSAPEQQDAFISPPSRAFGKPNNVSQQQESDSSLVKETKNAETVEVKKSSEKKSKKQKSAKAQSSDSGKGLAKLQHMKLSEFERTNISSEKSDEQIVQGEVLETSFPAKGDTKADKVSVDNVGVSPGKISPPASHAADDRQSTDTRGLPGQFASVSQSNTQAHMGQRAWKPAPGFKPKSLLEIQQEEERRAQEKPAVSEISTSLSSMSVLNPWGAAALNSDHNALSENKKDVANTGSNFGKLESSLNQKSKKSELHDLFWGDSVPNTVEKDTGIPDSPPDFSRISLMSSLADSVSDDNFIDAKDTKKSRRKSGKAKGVGAKASVPVSSTDVPAGSSSSDKAKIPRLVQQEKEVLPAVPSGPSLGDFVVWKGEPTNASPVPAWSADSGKLQKPTSLRDILKEQERKVSSSLAVPVPSPQKPAANQPARGGGPSWSVSSSSPAKATPSVQINSRASSHSKHKIEDDLFWGPLEQPKQESDQSDFPQLGNQGSRSSKNTPAKGNPVVSLSKQKSAGGRVADYSLSSSPTLTQPSLKGKPDHLAKYSEAMDFKQWCENECMKLTGSKDTSVLEYCLKQSRAEAEMLLKANLGSLDPNHEFIDNFLNYKDLLPVDVLEIAFKRTNDRKVPGSGAKDASDYSSIEISNIGGASVTDGVSKGGKKKGKKGKKVSPSVLGFNVVSNRIMMGEIQTVED